MVTGTATDIRKVRFLLFVLALAVSLAAGCHSLVHPNDLNSVLVTLKRTACDGTCPVYSVAIHGNGAVEYSGEFNVDIPGPQTAQIPPGTVRNLLRGFDEVHFYDLKEKYFEMCTDMPTAIISVSLDGKRKEVSNYFGGCERAKAGAQVDLAKLAEQIDEAAGTGRWITCDFECMRELVQNGLNVNAQAPDGGTPLSIAVQERDLKKTRLLLDAGAQINAAGGQGHTPLMWAAIEDDFEIVQELLARGADVNAKDKQGFTALDSAGGKRVREVLIREKDLFRRADLIFVGTVVDVGPPPKYRSGGFMALQEVRYKVEKVLKGVSPAGTGELVIQHVVVGGSRTADPSSEANRLSPTVFAPGSRLVVVARRHSSMWLGSDEDYGVIPATSSNLVVVKQLLNR